MDLQDINNNFVIAQELQEKEEELKVKEAEVIRGNPLINNATSFNVQRRLVV